MVATSCYGLRCGDIPHSLSDGADLWATSLRTSDNGGAEYRKVSDPMNRVVPVDLGITDIRPQGGTLVSPTPVPSVQTLEQPINQQRCFYMEFTKPQSLTLTN